MRRRGCDNRDRNRSGVVTVRIDRNGRRTSCGVDARNGKRGRVIAAALAIRLLRGGAYRCARRVGNGRGDLVSRTRVHHKRRGNTRRCERQYVRQRGHVRNVVAAALIADASYTSWDGVRSATGTRRQDGSRQTCRVNRKNKASQNVPFQTRSYLPAGATKLCLGPPIAYPSASKTHSTSSPIYAKPSTSPNTERKKERLRCLCRSLSRGQGPALPLPGSPVAVVPPDAVTVTATDAVL